MSTFLLSSNESTLTKSNTMTPILSNILSIRIWNRTWLYSFFLYVSFHFFFPVVLSPSSSPFFLDLRPTFSFRMANDYHTSMETNGLAPTDPWFSNSVDRTLDPELDPHRDLDFAMHQPITWAPSTPTAGSTYGLRPRISLTPHGKIQQECQSLATARRNNAQPQQEAQPDAYPETPPRTDLTALEETMGGAVSVEDLQHMIAMDPSRDLTPPSPAKNMTPELLDSRRVQLDALLDQHKFS